MTYAEQLAALMATLNEQNATAADLERRLKDAVKAVRETREAIRAVEFDAWLEDDRAVFPTPVHGVEEVMRQWRYRTVSWVESRTEKGSIRLVHERREIGRKPERRTGMTLRVGTADYVAACEEYGVEP